MRSRVAARLLDERARSYVIQRCLTVCNAGTCALDRCRLDRKLDSRNLPTNYHETYTCLVATRRVDMAWVNGQWSAGRSRFLRNRTCPCGAGLGRRKSQSTTHGVLHNVQQLCRGDTTGQSEQRVSCLSSALSALGQKGYLMLHALLGWRCARHDQHSRCGLERTVAERCVGSTRERNVTPEGR